MLNKLSKLRNILFIIFVMMLLGGTVLYMLFFKEPENISEREKRELTMFSDVVDTSFMEGTLQDRLEAAMADQFVLRYQFVNDKSQLDLFFSKLFGEAISDQAVLTKVGETAVRQVGDSHYLINNIFDQYDSLVEARFIERADQINELAAKYPDINFYVYKPNQVYETDLFDAANDVTSYGSYYRQVLENNLDIPYAELKIPDLDTYKRYFYESDHHWNYQGSYQGYKDIVSLIFGDEESVLKPESLLTFDDELLFSGTYESRVGYIYAGEPFYVYTFDLPDYAVYINGEAQEIYDMDNFADHLANRDTDYFYDLAYHTYGSFVEYKSGDDSKGTLLIIGDSYAGAVEPLLMEHFSTIYFVQPLDYYYEYGEYFDYDAFLQEHDVDDVLFMYTVENYFYSSADENRYEFFNIYHDGGVE